MRNLFTFTTLLALLILPSTGWAVVTPLSTFSFDVVGFNSTSDIGYLLAPDETSTFGTTQTFTGAGFEGQNITISSSEHIGPTSTTDTFIVSTPTSFITTAQVNGETIDSLQFDIGDPNSGGNTVNYLTPVAPGYSLTGYLLYEGSKTFSLTPQGSFTNNNESLAATEDVTTGGGAIDSLSPNTFGFSISYPNFVAPDVPEPSSMALVGLGLISCAVAVFRRRRTA